MTTIQSLGTVSTSNMRTSMICLAIACNALCAGGVYSFPLISPALIAHMKFSQTQITAIALAGMVGQYPFAAIVGKVFDRHGARVCSLIASIFFSLGFGLFAYEIYHTPDELPAPSNLSFWKLAIYFGLVGLASVFSYFSIVFSATQTFPTYMGIASGTSMALFGCSPLLLSALASKYFTYPQTGLNVTQFLRFLAILTGVIHCTSAFFLPSAPNVERTGEDITNSWISAANSEESSVGGTASERQPLLDNIITKSPRTYIHPVPVQEPQHGTVTDLLQDRCFWILVLIILIVVGQCEMVMANLSSLFLSLPSSSPTPSLSSATISTQIQLLSISNTASRLLIGPIADLVSPVAAYLHNGVWSFPRKQHISRIAFLVGAALLLTLTFMYVESGMTTREAVWLLSTGVGIAYGTTFTVLPGILSSIWGLPNLGRNFGIVSYAPFFGTSIFSYIYALIAERHTPEGKTVCEGKECWEATFALGIAVLVVAAGLAGVLWRVWRGRV